MVQQSLLMLRQSRVPTWVAAGFGGCNSRYTAARPDLKGWYRSTSETQARPCHQTMERQTDERVELYAERDACGAEFPENGTPFAIDDNPPSEGELRIAVSQLSHG